MKKRRFMAIVMAVAMTVSSIPITGTPVWAASRNISANAQGQEERKKLVSADKERVSMYRVYNKNSGEHFYTANSGERNHLVKLGWHDEGIGWVAPKKSDKPVYRLYNKNGGEHHYTLSLKEKKHLVSVGWKDEGIGWYSDEAKGMPVYRQYNPHAFSNNHNYSTNEKEKRHLISIGWKDEGIGWYGLKNRTAADEPDSTITPEGNRRVTAKSNVKSFDPDSSSGKNEIASFYNSIQDYWVSEDAGGEHWKIVVSEDSSLLKDINNGKIVTNDIIVMPANEYFSVSTSFKYKYHDDDYSGGKTYNASDYEVLHLDKPDITELFQNQEISLSSTKVNSENPVAFVWTPEEGDITSSIAADNQTVRNVGAGTSDSQSTDVQKSLEQKADYGDSSQVKESGLQLSNIGKAVKDGFFKDFSDASNGSIGTKFNNCVLYDKDGDEKTVKDRIVIDGEFSLTDIHPDFNMDWSFLKVNQVKTAVTWNTNNEIKATWGGEMANAQNLVDAMKGKAGFSNERKVLGVNLSGVDMSQSIVLAAVGINLDSGVDIDIKSIQDRSIRTIVLPTMLVMLTMDMSGNVNATVVSEYNFHEYNEVGLNIQRKNYNGYEGTFNPSDYASTTNLGNNFDAGIINLHCASPNDRNKKAVPDMTLTMDANATFNIGISGSPAIMVAGIIPAYVQNSLAFETSGSAKGILQNKQPYVQGSAHAKAALVARVTAHAKFTSNEKEFFNKDWPIGDLTIWSKSWDLDVKSDNQDDKKDDSGSQQMPQDGKTDNNTSGKDVDQTSSEQKNDSSKVNDMLYLLWAATDYQTMPDHFWTIVGMATQPYYGSNGRFTLTADQAREVGYALSTSYNGELPELSGGIDAEKRGDNYYFAGGDIGAVSGELRNIKFNTDKSVDVDMYESPWGEEEVWTPCCRFHLVPNTHVNQLSIHPWYYSIENYQYLDSSGKALERRNIQLSKAQLEEIAEELGVPDSLDVTFDQGQAEYWEAGGCYRIFVQVLHNGEVIAMAGVNPLTGDMLNTIWRYNPDNFNEKPSVIHITTLNDLRKIQNNLSGNYVLDTDLNLSGNQWTPMGNMDTPFTGTLNGNGHSISGLTVTINSTTDSDGGLFGVIKNGTIQNVKLSGINTYVNVGGDGQLFSFAGGIAGEIIAGQISNCSVTGKIVSEGRNKALARAGGVCASMSQNSSVTDCSVDADIVSESDVANSMAGGITAWLDGSVAEKCLTDGTVTCNSNFYSYCGGISASGGNSTVKNCVVLSDSINTTSPKNNIHPIGNFVTLLDNLVQKNISGNFSNTENVTFISKEDISQGTYEKLGWDFSKIWYFANGKPVIR